MKISLKNSKAGEKRCCADDKRVSKVRFMEIYETIESCQGLKKTELMELNRLIKGKLKAFQQVPEDKTALSTRGVSQREAASLRKPSPEVTESANKYKNFFWRWHDKLASLGEKNFDPDSKDENSQNPYNKISY